MTFLRRNLVLISFLSLIVQLDVYAEKINLNKEINLFELSKKYPRCKKKSYKDDCYYISRGRDFSYEGYWKKNRLWEGIHKDENLNKITHKYIDGIRVNIYRECEKNILSKGWYLCKGGDKYKPFRNGRFDQLDNFQGQFIYKWSNGDIYEGNYKDDLKHGYGKFYWAGGNIYQGNYKDDLKHGYGKVTFSNGDVYVGNWEDGVKHGYGKYTWADGDTYEGNWYKGEMVDK